MKKVLLFTTRFYPHIGGVENVVADIFRYSQIDMTAIVSNDTFRNMFEKFFPIKTDEYNGKKILRVWMDLPKSILGVLSFAYRFVISLIAIVIYIKRSKTDIVNYHFPDDSIMYFAIAHWILKFSFVVNIHGNDLHLFAKKFLNKLFFEYVLEHSAKIVVNTEYMKKELNGEYPISQNKTEVISNWINLEEISQRGEVKDIPQKYIFFVGRLVKKKGVDVLIRAFAKLKFNGLVLVIEGMAEEYENLKKLCEDLNLQDKVIFKQGKLSSLEKFEYMRHAIFGVVPSRIEPFGIVALEYMACGTPVICSKTGGLIELVKDNENGILFENENVEELANKMEMLLTNEGLRKEISANQVEYVKSFDVHRVVKKYDELYTSLIKK